ncbi:DUF6063 family protein [Guptibacillus hwajinpoensis]|uniref:DUF6063 family protein n=1 Tax=Guptibacillus hwajinpoensis TaxID=208199 RepID=UPI00384E144C
MNTDSQTKAFDLHTKLLVRGALSKSHELVIEYHKDEKMRSCLRRLCKSEGTEVFEKGEHIHLITLPDGSIYATSYTQAREGSSTLKVVDFYIMAFIQATFCWEIDNDYSHRMSIEREGVTYPQLEEMVNKLFNDWKTINDESGGEFSEEFKIAVERIYEKWKHMSYRASRKYSPNTREGLIHKSMLYFRDGNLVHISDNHRIANIVFPTTILYERLDYIFHNIDRYQMLKSLINDSLEDFALEDSTEGSEDSA